MASPAQRQAALPVEAQAQRVWQVGQTLQAQTQAIAVKT